MKDVKQSWAAEDDEDEDEVDDEVNIFFFSEVKSSSSQL